MDKFTKILLGVVGVGVAVVLLIGVTAKKHEVVSQVKTKLSSYLRIGNATDAHKVEVLTSNPSASPEVKKDDSEKSSTSDSTSTPGFEGKRASEYVVKEGDTYGCIAEKYYGSYENYTDIMQANPTGETGYGEYELFVGATITLPAVNADNIKPASSLCGS